MFSRRAAWYLCLPALLIAPSRPVPAAEVAIAGKVLDPQGKAAGGAAVYLIIPTRYGDASFQRAKAGPDGAFTISYRSGDTEQPLQLVAMKPGYGAAVAPVKPQEPRSDVEIRLTPETEVTGHLMDRQGKPIAGATTRVIYAHWRDWIGFPETFPALSAVSDRKGAFRLRGLPEEGQVTLRFAHPRYARWEQPVRPGQGPRLSVRLRPAARIVGRVLYEGTLRPAAGIKVSCQRESRGDDGYWANARAVTDARGRYRLDNLPPGRYRVTLLHVYGESPKEWVAPGEQVDNLAEGKEAVCADMILTRGGFVTGKVTDRETGAPLVGAHVSASRVVDRFWEPGPDTKTTASGVYQLRLPAGNWQLQVAGHPGYVQLWDERREPSQVTVALGKTTGGIDFDLLRGAEVTGVVLDPEGRPDPNARIWAPYASEQPAGKGGAFTLRGLPPGTPLTLLARGSDRSLQAALEVTPKKGESDPVTIRLQRCFPVTGKITDAGGRPLKGVEVRTERDIPVGPTTRWYARPDATTTDAAGRFTLWLLPGISHRLVAGAEGYGDTRKTGVAVQSGGVEIGDLALQKADRVIAGRVTDVMGDPVAGARISVWSQAQPQQRSAVTDAQGRYRIERLAAGRVQVELEHPAYSFEFRNSVQTGSTRVDFTLTPDESRRPKERLKPGDPAPEIAAAQWLNGGGARSLKSLRGQVVILQFATPYNPAVEAASDRLNALRRKYGARGVSILALYDASLPPGETAAYVRARRLPYPVGLVPQTPLLGWNSAPFKRYGVYAVPSLFVIDRSGKVRAVNPSPAELERQVQTLARGR